MQYTARIVVKPENLADLISPIMPEEYWYNPFATDPAALEAKRMAWYQTAAGKEFTRLSERNAKVTQNIRFCVLQKDGSFRFEDLPAGDYAMVISVTDNCGMGFNAGAWHYQTTFTMDEANDETPMDLGELVFEKRE